MLDHVTTFKGVRNTVGPYSVLGHVLNLDFPLDSENLGQVRQQGVRRVRGHQDRASANGLSHQVVELDAGRGPCRVGAPV